MCLIKSLRFDSCGYIVTHTYSSLPPLTKLNICNGMGSTSTWWNRLLRRFIPSSFWGLNMDPVADIHDYMYWRGGRAWDKVVADMCFLYNMLRHICLAGAHHRKKRYALAVQYFTAVLLGGGKSFNFKVE